MARLSSLNVLLDPTGKDFLAEGYGKVIANVQKKCISASLKNEDLSGDPATGTLEAKRFANRTSQAYGTARSGGKGEYPKAKPVVISIDQDKELITEVENKDVTLYGVDGFIQKQFAMDELSMQRQLERAFFAQAVTDGTAFTTATTAIQDIMEELIQKVETVSNEYVDGVPRELITVVCNTATYGAIRSYLDGKGVTPEGAEFGSYHGVRIESSTYLPATCKAVVMAKGSVAQPVLPTIMNPLQIPMSNAFAFGIFYSYGVKTVTPDLIFKWMSA